MIINNSWGQCRRPHLTLPTELHTRLGCVIRQQNYSDQLDTFSMVLSHSEDSSYRWNLYHRDLPYLHLMETRDHGNHMVVHVLIPTNRSILTLEKNHSDWRISSTTAEEDIEDIIPDRFENENSDWLLKPASPRQMQTVARQLHLPRQRVPKLTAYNAQILLQTTIVMRHLPYIRRTVEHTISGIRQNVRSQRRRKFAAYNRAE